MTLTHAEPGLRQRVRERAVRQAPSATPTVSVIIPCFNYAGFLPDAIGSALAQDHVRVEVIVVDDASSDGSVEVARAAARDDTRVRVIAHQQNSGPVQTFNDGLREAGGEFLIRLDADDLLTPGSVARAVALAGAHPEVGLIYGHPVHFTGSVPDRFRARARFWDVWSGSAWLELRCRLGANCITSPEVVMRASVVREVGGQRNLDHTHDMEMWLRIARESDVGWVGGCDQAWHREHDASRSARQVDVMTDLDQRAEAFQVLFTDGRGRADENERMLRLARAALADEALARTMSAYVRGRGGTAETDAYQDYAARLGVDLDRLAHSAAVESAKRLGPRRARYSPALFTRAVAYRLGREAGAPRLRAKGI